MNPLILAIETSCGSGGVALTRGGLAGGTLVAEYSQLPDRRHTSGLLGKAEALMRSCGLSWDALDAIAVSRGPGSFTGLRIGMAAAQGLAFASAKPLIAVPTLDALAAQLAGMPFDMPVCALLDARKNQVYAALFHVSEPDEAGLPHRLSSYQACAPEELAASFTTAALCLGPGLAVCGEEFSKHPFVRPAPAGLCQARAAQIGFAAANMLEHGRMPDDNSLLYVRASDAELNRKAPL